MIIARFATVLITGLLLTGGLAGSPAALAEGAEEEETDIAYSRRLTTRVQRAQTSIKYLQDTVDDGWGRSASPQRRQQREDSLMTPSNQTRNMGNSSDWGRFKLKLKSMSKKAEKLRMRLQAPMGSKTSSQDLDREAIEAGIRQLENEIREIDRDMRIAM